MKLLVDCVIFLRYNFLPARDPETLGDCSIAINTLNVGDEKQLQLRLVDPSNGKKLDSTVGIIITIVVKC